MAANPRNGIVFVGTLKEGLPVTAGLENGRRVDRGPFPIFGHFKLTRCRIEQRVVAYGAMISAQGATKNINRDCSSQDQSGSVGFSVA
jgi:hypothetical protein